MNISLGLRPSVWVQSKYVSESKTGESMLQVQNGKFSVSHNKNGVSLQATHMFNLNALKYAFF
jgi:hypothetical protein